MTDSARRSLALQQLQDYALAFPEENASSQALCDLVTDTAEPFSRQQAEPGHLTASGLVVTKDGYIALLFHNKLKLWLQPGGHIESSDASLEAAARREVHEELGLDKLELWQGLGPIFDLDIHQIPGFPGAAAHQHFDVRFLFSLQRRVELCSPEGLATRWCALTEARSLPDASLGRAIDKILSRLAFDEPSSS